MAEKPRSRKDSGNSSDERRSSAITNDKGEKHFHFGKKPATREEGGFGSSDKPYRKPKDDGFSDKPKRSTRSDKDFGSKEGGSERRPYSRKPKEDGFSDKPRRSTRFSDDKPFEPKEGSSERRPYSRKPKEEGFSDKPRRSTRFSDDKPYDKKEGSAERRPYSRKPKEDGFSDKPRRSTRFSDDKPFDNKEGSAERRPYSRKPKDEGFSDKPRRSTRFPDDKPFDKKEGTRSGFRRDAGDKPKSFDKGDAPRRGPRKDSGFSSDRKPRVDSRVEKPASRGGAKFESKPRRGRKDSDDFDLSGEWLNPDDFQDELGKARKFQGRKSSGSEGYSPDFLPKAKKEYRPRISKKQSLEEQDGKIRLNKYIANAGICSRREADDLISAGAIKVNGEIVTQLGFRVSPTDKIQYGDQTLSTEKKRYLLLNKPKDYITTANDPEGRRTVMDLVQEACRERLYPVGRLDRATTGLLLMTNDGELATKLMHPSHEIRKVYHATLDKNLQAVDLKKILEGLDLEDGRAEVDEIAWASQDNKKEVGIVIHSGKNRIVRRIFEHLGYEVVKLDRTGFAGLTKKNLPRGKFRFLTEQEVNLLRMA
jgi:23S rRNA pseudouridine2605 synthase